ncbi:MAG: sigma-70 family RNA polymerase sigma factor [Lachnospiraceae bacterium]|nr:sigma-70 family RNA polymerase sigma factor [Lachnospiraceae bacterium]
MEQKWSYLVDEYRTMLYRIAFSNMKNPADAEDAVQEAFLRYMKEEKPIQNKEHEKAWLIRTTIHICLDILKSGWYQRTVPWSEAFERAAKNIYLPYQVRDDRTLEAVLRLPVHYRNPIYLFYYEDYTIHEIAGILNVKEATIKTRLRRGREEVKKILTEGRP